MRGERLLLRLGEYLVGRACQRLPQDVREERYREWAAELPAILHDPQVRFAPRRAARMLGYAADTLRGTALAPGRAQGRIARLSPAADLLFLGAGLVVVALSGWAIAQAPGDGQNYPWLVWGLLFVTYRTRKRARSAGRMTTLLGISVTLALGGAFLGNAVQAPGDWVNYFLAALILLPLLVGLPVAWWLRRLQARTGGRHAAPPGAWTFSDMWTL
jgi:hypothetical protein